MNVVKCRNGHFFDGDTYSKCPHCGEGIVVGNTVSAPSVDEKQKGFWERRKERKKQKNVPPQVDFARPVAPPAETFRSRPESGGSPAEFSGVTEALLRPEPAPRKSSTLSFWEADSVQEKNNAGRDLLAQEDSPLASGEAEPPAVRARTDESAEPDSENMSSLQKAVKNASASSDGKTMSYFSTAADRASKQEQPQAPAEPVVGWLVCVKGRHFGSCFSIYAGLNSIGRNVENRIVIADDNSVSRIKHASIVYEPKKRNFYLQPGESSGLTYLNGDYITESHKLSPRDTVELGDSHFLFVPLCGEDFSWEEYLPEGE